MRSYEEIEKDARDKVPFSNGTLGAMWMANWCDRCLVDAPYRNGLNPSGCPLILVSLIGKTPAEWMETEQIQEYQCLEARFPGDGGGEPRPKPEPPQEGLFPRPERQTRMLIQPTVPSEAGEQFVLDGVTA